MLKVDCLLWVDTAMQEGSPPLSAFRWGNSLRQESHPLNVFVFIKVCLRNRLAVLSPVRPWDTDAFDFGNI